MPEGEGKIAVSAGIKDQRHQDGGPGDKEDVKPQLLKSSYLPELSAYKELVYDIADPSKEHKDSDHILDIG